MGKLRPPAWLQRLLLLGGLGLAEVIAISVFADNAALQGMGGLNEIIAHWGAWAVHGCIAFFALYGTFAALQDASTLRATFGSLSSQPFGWKFLAVHGSALLVFCFLTFELYSKQDPGITGNGLVVAWLLTGLVTAAVGALAFVPMRIWVEAIRGTGWLGLYAALATIGACVVGNDLRSLWQPAIKLTYYLTSSLLSVFRDNIVSDPGHMLLGTQRFRVNIAPECSGFEGAGLMLAFGILYLLCFRRECRFPHALLLIPAGIVVLFGLNIVRIATLILLGDVGATTVALGGFHSQAGWIAFTAVAFGFTLVARRIDWLKPEPLRVASGASEAGAEAEENPVAPYLAPFLAIVAVGMLVTAASAGFEWLYPLRFLAAAAVLWIYRGRLAQLDWKFGKTGIAAGVVVFALWIAFDRFNGTAQMAMPAALAGAEPFTRFVWIAVRALAASVTVPIAEELAFRGFLMRRLASADFEELPFGKVTLAALAISAIAFGLLHGARWIPGVAAGTIYGFSAIRKGRIGEAVAGHAVTNALLAIYVLALGQWQFW
ncbi:MAG: exosortase E/protease, VPEID-CTERM system [Acidobacteriota bacterium]